MDTSLISDLKSLVSALEISTAVVNPQDFAFEGFDPMDLIRSLHSKAHAQRLSNSDFISDMATIVAIGLMRGTLSSKSMGKTSRSGQNRITVLKSRYSLMERVSRDNARAATIPRVVNSFPLLASRINKEMNLSRGFTGPFDSRDLPAAMQHVAFASLIPQNLSDTTSLVADAYVGFALDMGVTINRTPVDRASLNNAYTQQNTYLQAALNSPMYTQAERIQIMIDLELTSHESYTSITKQANKLLTILGSSDLYPLDYDGFLRSLGIVPTPQTRFQRQAPATPTRQPEPAMPQASPSQQQQPAMPKTSPMQSQQSTSMFSPQQQMPFQDNSSAMPSTSWDAMMQEEALNTSTIPDPSSTYASAATRGASTLGLRGSLRGGKKA
jgi:hypothetical protein